MWISLKTINGFPSLAIHHDTQDFGERARGVGAGGGERKPERVNGLNLRSRSENELIHKAAAAAKRVRLAGGVCVHARY